MRRLVEQGVNLNIVGAIELAVQYTKCDVLAFLLNNGCPIQAYEHTHEWNALHRATLFSASNKISDRFEKVKMLLEHGADPNAKTQTHCTPLHNLADANGSQHLRAHITYLFLSYGADPRLKDFRGRTPADMIGDSPYGQTTFVDPVANTFIRDILTTKAKELAIVHN